MAADRDVLGIRGGVLPCVLGSRGFSPVVGRAFQRFYGHVQTPRLRIRSRFSAAAVRWTR